MVKWIAGTIGLFLVLYLLFSSLDGGYRKEIEKKVESLNGEIVTIDSVGIFEEDPFKWHERNSKNPAIYKFTYKQEGKIKEGWVSFLYFSDIWIVDGKKTKE